MTIRLFTDRGRFSGSGEGYGASAAFDDATDVLERNVLDGKEREHADRATKADRDRERAAQLVGWWLGN
ncbi:hypothetical protein VB773_21145 [Haloarculaceae archaeon H-GB2-1]|nr:hypothetical protein [Haloarculaceae archaeon H-GB11]MEA5409827.1 hypothetical protein [Haloarculaceae archaeon H-GB2-1]